MTSKPCGLAAARSDRALLLFRNTGALLAHFVQIAEDRQHLMPGERRWLDGKCVLFLLPDHTADAEVQQVVHVHIGRALRIRQHHLARVDRQQAGVDHASRHVRLQALQVANDLCKRHTRPVVRVQDRAGGGNLYVVAVLSAEDFLVQPIDDLAFGDAVAILVNQNELDAQPPGGLAFVSPGRHRQSRHAAAHGIPRRQTHGAPMYAGLVP